ncbi:uncharacterized protein LOC106866797 [Brachypodium distachyon]|uniref:uncharacterized protein LOC106866797 n=1 Tax=Brachypodium distachyon TaxID=15368 RepID=UPI0001C70810|nr:uncharacterized protein LOC106866797 [Brachypodium distachyon]|eukprot:XP_014758094.1 uncharacterized protein LOC106866797 [Brachypodium distachyon]
MGGGNKELSCTNTNDNIADVHHDSRGIGGHGSYDPAAAYYSCPPIAYPPPGVHGCPPSCYLPNQGYGYGSMDMVSPMLPLLIHTIMTTAEPAIMATEQCSLSAVQQQLPMARIAGAMAAAITTVDTTHIALQ